MINKASLLGRVGKDPELRTLENGNQVANFSLATSETYKDKQGNKQEKTEWHNLVIWGKLAEIAGKYVKKGDLLYVEGKITTRSWEKDGVTRYTTEIVVNDLKMLGGKSGASQPAPAASASPGDGPTDNPDLPF